MGCSQKFLETPHFSGAAATNNCGNAMIFPTLTDSVNFDKLYIEFHWISGILWNSFAQESLPKDSLRVNLLRTTKCRCDAQCFEGV